MNFVSAIHRMTGPTAGLLLAAAFLPAQVKAQETIKITSTHFSPYTVEDNSGFHDILLLDAFRRIGRKVEFLRLPGERAAQNANTGIADGAMARIAEFSDYYPNLIQVPEPISMFEYTAFANDLDFSAQNGWASLKHYNVSIIRGWKILEFNIKDTQSLLRVRDIKQLFTLLDEGHTDVVVIDRWNGLEQIRQLGLKGIKAIEPPLATRNLYTFLHKSHADLVPQLARALTEMKKDGFYAEAYERALAPLVVHPTP